MERDPGLSKSGEMRASAEILGLILLSHPLRGKNSASDSSSYSQKQVLLPRLPGHRGL